MIIVAFVATLYGCGSKSGDVASTESGKYHFDENPFDLNATRLAEHYWGHSCEGVIHALEDAKNKYKKDEFETTEAYNQRTAQLSSIPLGAKLNTSDILAFQGLPEDLADSYDADAQKLNVQDSWRYIDKHSGRYGDVKIIVRKPTESITYVGNNGFGATANVKKESYEVCALANQNMARTVKFEIPMSPDQAKLHKNKLSALYVGRLLKSPNAIPQTYSYHFSQSPTLSVPEALSEYGYEIIFQPLQVWVIDRESGEVLAKQIVAQPKPEDKKHVQEK